MENWEKRCDLWRRLDGDTAAEIDSLTPEQRRACFGADLAFGTGGLRGLMGAGTNRMNVYTVRRAARAVAQWVKAEGAAGRGVAIACDTRHNSTLFALQAALTLCAAGVKAHLFEAPAPTPVLSFAVRDAGYGAGIVITASHNPPAYNGFKVYGGEGYQLTPEAAGRVAAHMEAWSDVSAIPVMEEKAARAAGLLCSVGQQTAQRFTAAVCAQAGADSPADLCVVYSPLHGTGAAYVPPVLEAKGYRLHTVAAQMMPNGDFSTAASPNPEDPRALQMGMELAGQVGADIVLATDPDSDRVGAAVKGEQGYVRLTGNQLGALLVDYLMQARPPREGDMLIKTVVTGELGADIARAHGLGVKEVLTGFKYIGEQACAWEKTGEKRFYFGYEESCGYLAATHALDKDGVSACLLACGMAAALKAGGITPLQRLEQLYARYGYTLDALDSFELQGEEGAAVIARTMACLRGAGGGFGEEEVTDYALPGTGLPTADVLKYRFSHGWMAVRPSGTEPKLKVYYCLRGKNEAEAGERLEALRRRTGERLKENGG